MSDDAARLDSFLDYMDEKGYLKPVDAKIWKCMICNTKIKNCGCYGENGFASWENCGLINHFRENHETLIVILSLSRKF